MFFARSYTQNNGIILRNILHLRLVVLGVVCASILIVHGVFYALVNVYMLLVVTVLVGCWSLFILNFNRSNSMVSVASLMRESVVDGLWLLCVVLLSGRSANPFIYYYFVLVAISASVYPWRAAWLYAGAGVVVYTGLLYFDINKHFQHFQSDYQFHLVGMWLNFVGSTLVTCFFVNRLAHELRLRQLQLEQVREETLKNEQLIGVGTIAASTVHALATPLSTLTILLEGFYEQKNKMEVSEEKGDVKLMLAQIKRCKSTMNKLSMLSREGAVELSESVANIMDALKEHYLLVVHKVTPIFTVQECDGAVFVKQAILLRHALLNLINNAIDACNESVVVSVHNSANEVVIEISNDGEGFTEEMIMQWGTPVVSTKKFGLGIGSFLANSTIEKQGGTVEIRQKSADFPRTSLVVTLPAVAADILDSTVKVEEGVNE